MKKSEQNTGEPRTEAVSSKIYGIQILRALCCTGILIAHSCYYAEVNFSSIKPGFLSYTGRVGMLNYVVIFFVLSGYLTARQIYLGGVARGILLAGSGGFIRYIGYRCRL